MFKVGIITSSDKASTGEREDLSGPIIAELVKKKNYEVISQIILADEKDQLVDAMIYMTDELGVDLILTTGGTGFSKRDVIPEATLLVCDRVASGIAEAIRYYSLSITPRAMLSRAVSGIRDDTLIINLPGSPKAVKEALDYSLDSIHHGLEILTNKASDCARK